MAPKLVGWWLMVRETNSGSHINLGLFGHMRTRGKLKCIISSSGRAKADFMWRIVLIFNFGGAKSGSHQQENLENLWLKQSSVTLLYYLKVLTFFTVIKFYL